MWRGSKGGGDLGSARWGGETRWRSYRGRVRYAGGVSSVVDGLSRHDRKACGQFGWRRGQSCDILTTTRPLCNKLPRILPNTPGGRVWGPICQRSPHHRICREAVDVEFWTHSKGQPRPTSMRTHRWKIERDRHCVKVCRNADELSR